MRMKKWHVIAIDGCKIVIDKECLTANLATIELQRLRDALSYGLLSEEQKLLLEAEKDSHKKGTLGYRLSQLEGSDLAKFQREQVLLKEYPKVVFKREFY